MMGGWKELKYDELKDTISTVQLWTQIVGKIRLRAMPWINHSWHVALYVSPLGLTTESIPFKEKLFRIEFDFINHNLIISSSSGATETIKLEPGSISKFYDEIFRKLESMDIDVNIYPYTNELEPVIPFKEDHQTRNYNPEKIREFWGVLIKIHNLFLNFRAEFIGKCSPVHLFWGAFDLAVTRFSGRKAPKHPGGAPHIPLEVMQEAYSHEVSSAGFFPGNDQFPHPAFYSYCYPTPENFGEQKIEPEEAFFSEDMGEYFLLYDDVRKSDNPEKTLMQFLKSTYEAAAETLDWNREELEFDFSEFEK